MGRRSQGWDSISLPKLRGQPKSDGGGIALECRNMSSDGSTTIMLTLVSWTATVARAGLDAGAKAEAVASSERVAAIFIVTLSSRRNCEG